MQKDLMRLTFNQKRAILDYVISGLSVKPIMEDCREICDAYTDENGEALWDAVGEFLKRIGGHLDRFMPKENPL